MLVRDMNMNDIDEVLNIENLCFKDGRYNKDQLIYELNNELSKSLVAIENNKIIGFLFYMITFNSSTIVQIATHPEYQHKGVGTSLMKNMFNYIASLGYGVVETITLEVRKQNEIAHQFYLKQGFKDIIIKPKYYSNGDDAIYMSRILL